MILTLFQNILLKRYDDQLIHLIATIINLPVQGGVVTRAFQASCVLKTKYWQKRAKELSFYL